MNGLTVFVGRKIGEGKREEAGKIIGSGIWLFGVIAIALTVIMVAAAPSLVEIMHAPKEAYRETATYITICSIGTVFIVAYNLIGSIFRGIGDSKVPLITVFIACVLNIVGDLILVALFHMGAAGAAIATVFAQAVSVLISLVIIRMRELPFTFSLKDVRARGIYISKILKLGIPIALQDLLASISFLVILAIMNGLGLVVSAGIFAKDTAIILAAAEYLKAYAIDCIFTSFLFCFIGYFNGCGGRFLGPGHPADIEKILRNLMEGS